MVKSIKEFIIREWNRFSFRRSIFLIVLACSSFFFGMESRVSSGPELTKMQSLFSSLNSPEKIIKYLHPFEYQHDLAPQIEPRTKSPERFLKDGKGDCKDFSNFAYKCAQFNDIPSRLYYIACFGKPYAHAVCIWKIDHKFIPICNVTATYNKVLRFNHIDDLFEWYKARFKWERIDSYHPIVLLPYFLLSFPNLDHFLPINERFEE